MLLCLYGPPFCRSQDIPGVSADIPSRSVAPVPLYACQPTAIHHTRLAGTGTLDQAVGNCSLSLITLTPTVVGFKISGNRREPFPSLLYGDPPARTPTG